MNVVRRRFLAGLGLLPVAIAAPAATATSTAATTSTTAAGPQIAKLKKIRTGRHKKFDRIVLDMRGPVPTDIARAWGPVIRQPGSGHSFWLYGWRFLTVRVTPADAHNNKGEPTYEGRRRFLTPKLRNVKAVGFVSDFGGEVVVGIGTRRRRKVRVFTLKSPTRVVIDIFD